MPSMTMPPIAQHSTFSSGSGSQTFFSESSRPHPPSTHISISVANRVSKGKSQARTLALSDQTSSIALSYKHARMTNAELTMANAATMTSMMGMLNQTTDCMISFQQSSVAGLSSTSIGPQTTIPTLASAGTSPVVVSEYQILTLEFLQQDKQLDAVNPAICGDIFCEILTNHLFAWAFSQTSNATLHHSVTLSWYQRELRSRAAQSALPPLSAASSSLFSVLSPPLTALVSMFDSPILLHNSLTHSPALFDNQPAAGSPMYNNHMSFPLATPSSSSLSHPASKGMMSTFEDGNHLA